MNPGSIVAGRSSSGGAAVAAAPAARCSCGPSFQSATVGVLRALVVSNMLPDAAHPERGQLRPRPGRGAARSSSGLEVELFEFPPGRARSLRAARARATAARHAQPPATGRFDVVHAHFGLTAWPALAVPARVRALTVHGTDLRHPRTRLATAAALPRSTCSAPSRESLVAELPGPGARAERRCCLRRGPRALPVAAARARRAPSWASTRRPVPAVPRRPGRAGEAPRPRARAGRAPRESSCMTLGGVDARARAAVGERRQRGARALRARGLRAGGARGARLRRARAGHAGRHPSRGARRTSRGRCARRSSSSAGARRWSPICASPIPACRDVRAPMRFSATAMAERVRCGLAGRRWSDLRLAVGVA